MLYIMIAAIVLVADIFTKNIAIDMLMPIRSIEVIGGILNFTYVENKGIAFGLFSGQMLIFIITSILVIFAIVGLIIKTDKADRTMFLMLGASLTASGALGNLIDRLTKGYVVDFIEVTFVDFPVFNIADIAVCVGAAMLIIHFFFFDKNENEEDASNE